MGRIARRKRGFRDGKRMRILSMLFGNNSGGGASSILDGAPFKAQLITSLILNMGTGSPTFTRATTATFTDFEGVLRTAISGEARFQGARRVANLLTYTEDAANAAWLVSAAGSGSTPTKTTNYAAAPDGTTTAQRVQFNVGAGTASTDVSAFYQSPVCTTALNSVWIKSATGSDQKITLRARASSTVDDSNITATSTWTQISKLQTGGTAIFAMVQRGDWKTANTADILIWHPQCEDVTGQAVQAAGEYVSVGVLSAPYHGAGVDGVKYFDTTLAGVPIPSSTLKGYLSEGSRQNICLQSNSFNTTWTEAGGTLGTAQNVTAPDGVPNSAWTMTDSDAAQNSGRVSGTLALTAAAYTFSIFVKKTVGAQSSYPAMWFLDAAVTTAGVCTIDTTNGIATVWTAYTGLSIMSGCSARCESFNSDYWRVSLTGTATAANWSARFAPAVTSNPNQSSGTFTASITGSAVFYGAQVELGSFASTYIPTTTVAVTRNADVLTYPSTGNVDGTKGWAYAEVAFTNPAFLTGLAANIVGTTTAGRLIEVNAANSLRCIDSAVNVATKTLSTPLSSSVSKVGSYWSVPSGMAVTANGESPATQATFSSMTTTGGIGIMCRNDGTTQPFGTIRNVRIGQSALSAAQLQGITT